MSGERGGEVTIAVSANHYADRGIAFVHRTRLKTLAMLRARLSAVLMDVATGLSVSATQPRGTGPYL